MNRLLRNVLAARNTLFFSLPSSTASAPSAILARRSYSILEAKPLLSSSSSLKKQHQQRIYSATTLSTQNVANAATATLATEESNEAKQIDYHVKNECSFDKYDAIPQILRDRLKELGYTKPFEIQDATLPHTLTGKDVVGKAFTGSGKTLAFAIPIICRVMKSEKRESPFPKCLVLSPTRELCLQLTRAIQDLSPDITVVSVYGGSSRNYQLNALNRKADVVCATPGRLRDMFQSGAFKIDHIETICLDEADELLNPNFLDQIKEVIEGTQNRQMFMFSATINREIQHLIKKYMKNPVQIDLTDGQKHKMPENVIHHIAQSDRSQIPKVVRHLLAEFKSERCILFVNQKMEARNLNEILRRSGIKSQDLHSDVSQESRQKIFQAFRQGRIEVLVATDVAARGLDVPEVNLVIQVNAPVHGVDFYVHRTGRTGRAGRIGNSILINTDANDDMKIREISRLVPLKKLKLPDNLREMSFTSSIPAEDDEFQNKYREPFASAAPGRSSSPSFGGRPSSFGGQSFSGDRFGSISGPRSNNRDGPRSSSSFGSEKPTRFENSGFGSDARSAGSSSSSRFNSDRFGGPSFGSAPSFGDRARPFGTPATDSGERSRFTPSFSLSSPSSSFSSNDVTASRDRFGGEVGSRPLSKKPLTLFEDDNAGDASLKRQSAFSPSPPPASAAPAKPLFSQRDTSSFSLDDAPPRRPLSFSPLVANTPAAFAVTSSSVPTEAPAAAATPKPPSLSLDDAPPRRPTPTSFSPPSTTTPAESAAASSSVPTEAPTAAAPAKPSSLSLDDAPQRKSPFESGKRIAYSDDDYSPPQSSFSPPQSTPIVPKPLNIESFTSVNSAAQIRRPPAFSRHENFQGYRLPPSAFIRKKNPTNANAAADATPSPSPPPASPSQRSEPPQPQSSFGDRRPFTFNDSEGSEFGRRTTDFGGKSSRQRREAEESLAKGSNAKFDEILSNLKLPRSQYGLKLEAEEAARKKAATDPEPTYSNPKMDEIMRKYREEQAAKEKAKAEGAAAVPSSPATSTTDDKNNSN